jgi:hypothetical protein
MHKETLEYINTKEGSPSVRSTHLIHSPTLSLRSMPRLSPTTKVPSALDAYAKPLPAISTHISIPSVQ